MKIPFLYTLLFLVGWALSGSAQTKGCDYTFQVSVRIMPIAQGCENVMPRNRQLDCTKSAIKEYLENRLVMPLSLLEKEDIILDQNCDFRIVINQAGDIASIKSENCQRPLRLAVELAAKDMPPLAPGVFDGKKQCVALKIPISYRTTVFSDEVLGAFPGELSIDTVMKKEKRREIFKVVEEMPRYYDPECEKLPTKAERRVCADEAMKNVIYANLQYPEEARAIGIEELVVIQFEVSKEGEVSHIQAVRGTREDLRAEGVRLVAQYLKEWIPGKQRGRPVRVQYNFPIRFELEK